MSYLEHNKLKFYAKDMILKYLNDRKDLAKYTTIVDETNDFCEEISWSAIYSDIETESLMLSNWNDFKEATEDAKFRIFHEEFSSELSRFFKNPGRFASMIVRQIVINVLYECDTIRSNWFETIALTEEVIDKLIEEVKEV